MRINKIKIEYAVENQLVRTIKNDLINDKIKIQLIKNNIKIDKNEKTKSWSIRSNRNGWAELY